MAQKKLAAAIAKSGETFQGGEKLLVDDLHILGLEDDTDHMKITFNNDLSVKCMVYNIYTLIMHHLTILINILRLDYTIFHWSMCIYILCAFLVYILSMYSV